MATTAHIIHHIGTPVLAFPNTARYWDSLWWNNDTGWADKRSADVFTDEERTTLSLPMDGEWVTVYVNEPSPSQHEETN